jgi:hypothetical protein
MTGPGEKERYFLMLRGRHQHINRESGLYIEGNLGNFLLAWMALTLPIVYVLRSSMTALLFIAGITWYACEVSYFHYPHGHAWWYWVY